MRLAILKEIKGQEVIILEYKEDQILSRIKTRIRENLVETEKFTKHSWNKDEVAAAVDKAWNELIVEFKEKTIVLP